MPGVALIRRGAPIPRPTTVPCVPSALILPTPPEVLLAVLALGLLVAVLAGGIGFFVSLRASTAQEAHQLTGVGMMVPLMLASVLLMAVMGNDDLRAMLAGIGAMDPRLVVGTVGRPGPGELAGHGVSGVRRRCRPSLLGFATFASSQRV